MSRLLVLTTPERELGYRLAGVTTRAVGSAREAEAAARRSPRARGRDVIALHAPYFDALAPPLRRRIDALASPLVVALPAGAKLTSRPSGAGGCCGCCARQSGTRSPSTRGRSRTMIAQAGAAGTAPAVGEIIGCRGPVVVARGLVDVRLYNVVDVGDAALPGEVIRLDGEAP